ncbi:hypothetical protein LOZ61_006655 [Ophidiomyces ophidiicola]|uniref:Uncharacterized protein n=1 Tax=Ophidiomyces ophidiicola TaxID=1387563 RepID=A0ACB8UN67_9EURO|nr:hypothetical protein LOZ61_006655 [Ophidiomyces ophidiicola]KAI1925585.1 hypothetical protein LOZ60_004101 [Ophidiomyces ophidiicola]KAI1926887.1 hypothetical protein LOZ64_000017 [Ophidiomyces ophidiicola]KAI1948180.1 hypothetical protein LOZ59_006431 [Ophidiomyces ophidiicola]KAI1965704.1 hypothetical protein LOZ56_005992 [Ophidiomyces ophidiicola]
MAPPLNTPANKPSAISAVYRAPAPLSHPETPLQHTTQHRLTTSLSSHTADNTTNKTTYLSELRNSVVSLQAEINLYLTARMEEDKAQQLKVGGKDESKDEENYGEEVVDDEDEED